MSVRLSARKLDSDLLWEVEELSGQNLYACYQCGKCSAGCPTAFGMEMLPHQVIRLLQLGEVSMALRSQSIWNCAACLTCSSRCPKGVDLAKVMEALRTILLRDGFSPMEPTAQDWDALSELPQPALVGAMRKMTL